MDVTTSLEETLEQIEGLLRSAPQPLCSRCLVRKSGGRMMSYGRRWSTETTFSTFKRLYEEYTIARNMENKGANC